MFRLLGFARPATLIALACVLLGGCGGFSVTFRTSGAASVADLQAEEAYKSTYSEVFGQLEADMQGFLASGSNPGPCNVGGSRQACYDLDARIIADTRAVIGALSAIPIPPRYLQPDGLLKAALQQSIEGLDLRNQAIAKNDDALWQRHLTVLQAAQQAINQAYAAFPEDNRPVPAP